MTLSETELQRALDDLYYADSPQADMCWLEKHIDAVRAALKECLEARRVDVESLKKPIKPNPPYGNFPQSFMPNPTNETYNRAISDLHAKGMLRGAVREDMVLVPRECTDEIAEAIANTAHCCGGIAESIWFNAISTASKGADDV